MPSLGASVRSVVIFVLALGLPARPAFSLEPAEIYERWGGAVVTVVGSRSLGSGFVIPPTGYVVTNFHVVERQEALAIILRTGERRPVTSVVLQDRDRDLAVMSVDPTGLPRVVLGDSNAVRPGDRVVAIGSPLGLPQTVTDGIISQVRPCPGSSTSCLQTTTPISVGSSGSPLFNREGQVVGVNRGYLQEGQNLNFAVTINELRQVLGEPIPRSPRLTAVPSTPGQPASPPAAAPSAYTLHLWNGSSVLAESYREVGDSIVYERGGGKVALSKSSVARIVRHEDGTVQQISVAPPAPARGSPSGPKVDVRELLARPRSTPSPRSEPVPPPSGSGTGQGDCGGASEDFSTAPWRVVALNLVRFEPAGGAVLVHIRGIRPPEIWPWQANRLLEEVLRAARQIRAARIESKGPGVIEATLCTDGRDVATHPKLTPFTFKQPGSP